MTPSPTRITRQQITQVTSVIGEYAVPGPTAGTWNLTNTPAQEIVAVFVNGLRQNPVQSFTIAGNVLTSQYWQLGDTVVCDYEY